VILTKSRQKKTEGERMLLRLKQSIENCCAVRMVAAVEGYDTSGLDRQIESGNDSVKKTEKSIAWLDQVINEAESYITKNDRCPGS
jgi:hypothetical protein